MKKRILLLLFICISVYGFSQTTKTPTTKSAAVKTPQPFVLTAKDSILCKTWKLATAEVFSVNKAPNEKQVNDALTFNYDQTASLIIEGDTYMGKWVSDKAKTLIIVTVNNTNEIVRLKIKKMDKAELIILHQDKDLITTTYTYNPAK